MPTVKPIEAESAPVEELMTRSQVARILGVSPTTVTRWAREGRLACRVTLGGHHRFERSLVEEIRDRMQRGSAVRPPSGGRSK